MSQRSLMPFKEGDIVLEHGDDWCLTETGRFYTREGVAADRDREDGWYRSLLSPAYSGAT